MLTFLNSLILALCFIPLGVVVAESYKVQHSLRHLILLVGYVLFAINEVLLYALGIPFYFYHVFIDSFVISLALPSLVSLDSQKQRKFSTLIFHYGFLYIGMFGALALAQVSPQQAVKLAVVPMLFASAFVLAVLLQHRPKHLHWFIIVVAFWLAAHMGMYEQPLMLNRLLTLGLFAAVTSLIEWQALVSSRKMYNDNHLLTASRNAVLAMLNDISSAGEYMSSVSNTLRRVLETITETLSAESACLYTVEEGEDNPTELRFAQSIGRFYPLDTSDDFVLKSEQLAQDHLAQSVAKIGQGIIGKVAKEGTAYALDRNNDLHEMNKQALNTRLIRNLIAVPFNLEDKFYGVIVAENVKGKSAFGENDIRLLQFLADQAATSIKNTHMYITLTQTTRLRQEANIAMKIQKQLLPETIPEPENLRISAYIKPAKEVGGDYYDFIDHRDGSLGIVIGDVSGKGVPAGMIMAIAKAVVNIVAQEELDVKEVVGRFCREMYGNIQTGHFMTLNYLRWEGTSRALSFAGAGHEYLLWFHSKTGRSEKIRAGGLAAGLMEDPSELIKKNELHMEKGDVVVLYTDGVTEARSSSGEMYTLGRLRAALESYAYLLNPDKIRENLIADVKDFMGKAEQYDDITLLVLSVVS